MKVKLRIEHNHTNTLLRIYHARNEQGRATLSQELGIPLLVFQKIRIGIHFAGISKTRIIIILLAFHGPSLSVHKANSKKFIFGLMV